ncbi:MAG: ABC transporter permease [Dyadobacter sp.]|uniref:ABC transporter permease n=1 Tax=Dyadobacter sp. TaxID=1914288 RepID=UPI001B1DA669|nr:ABC transporter permease [Dyadobacter sp.]MBO9611425.1 ABC transporter permease [Dyadobacter sp.]
MHNRYFKQFGRRLFREKTYTLLNMVGLAAGLISFAFIALWVNDELGFDKFNANYERIMRVTTVKDTERGSIESARSSAPVAQALLEGYEEIESTVRLERKEEIVQHNGQQTLQPGILLTEPSFFNVFSYKLIRGDAATALNDPYSLVLTESAAKKYFGQTDPIGKSLLIFLYDSTGTGANYKITGLAADPPVNAHFTFSMLGSFKTIEARRPELSSTEGWKDSRFYTYLLLKNNVHIARFIEKIGRLKGVPAAPQPKISTDAYHFKLQALKDIHLSSSLENELSANGSMEQIYIFSTIGLLILFLAGINYTNLATARSVGRAREVGVKKVIGASKTQLIFQYLSESVMIALIALALALGVSFFIEPAFLSVTGKDLSLFSSPSLLLFLAGVAVFLGLLSGAYPAFLLAGFKPLAILRGSFKSSGKGVLLRQSLIVSQFVITLILVISIVVIYSQMSYIKHKDLGYNKDALIMIRLNGNADVVKGYSAFKNELMASPFVSGLASSNSFEIRGLESGNARLTGSQGESVRMNTSSVRVDADYLAVYGLKLLAGRNIADVGAGGKVRQVVLNETAVAKAGWKNPEDAIGRSFEMDNQPGEVVGVVRDFHFNSLQHTIPPLAMLGHNQYFSRITIKIDPRKVSQSIGLIRRAWSEHFPVALLDYDFIDQQVKEQYLAEERFSSIILYFSALSLLIACLGLYGLIAFTSSQKTKEISIRKTLGATVNGIAVLLSKDYLKPVVLAGCIAMPIAWHLMQNWLQNFSYRIDIAWWMLGAPLLLVSVLAVITVSFQSIKAALVNPVEHLRSE